MMKKYSVLIIIGLLGLFLVQAIGYILITSPTFDEPNWVAIAWYLTHYWTWQGDYHVFMHPPLTFYLHGLPLRGIELWRQSAVKEPPEGELAERLPYPYSNVLQYNTVFTLAKCAMLPLTLGLSWSLYLWARQLYGRSAGVLAVALCVLNPYLIAYSTNLSTDLAIACFMFWSTYWFWKFCQQPSVRRGVITGVVVGLTFLTRVSAVVLLPIFLGLGLLWLIVKGRNPSSTSLISLEKPAGGSSEPSPEHSDRNSVRAYLVGACVILGIAGLILHAGYLFDIQPVRAFHQEQERDVIYQLFKDRPIPFGAYVNTFRLQQSFLFWMERTYFFAGRVRSTVLWYYNIVAFVLRNPVPLLALLGATLVGWRWRRRQRLMHELFLLIPIGVLSLFFSVVFPVAGFRFMLPIFPFVFVWVSQIITWDIFARVSGKIILGALLAWLMLSALMAAPDYIGYCNELAGGTDKCNHWFDSDFGQDLKGLGRYLTRHQISGITLAYHGTGIPEYYGVRYVTPPEDGGACRAAPGIFAVSQDILTQDPECAAQVQHYIPLDQIGHSIFIYGVPDNP